jgi:predicted nucleotidyltransferase component of viral defense system
VPFNIDIGVGDVVVPKAVSRKINIQLPDFEVPEIMTYSLESAISEKFDAILQRYELTGRMKDFYDIYYLAKTFDFSGVKLQTAIFETLQNRSTPYKKDSFIRVVQLVNNDDMKIKWRYFLKSIKDESLDFAVVINEIKAFLEPVYNAMVNETEWQKLWDRKEQLWK